ncbi:type I secretion system permease/ATPase [Rhizobium lusitanum]|uniref:PrtD family type I secretion system ABC transporter n=1 Tax=Rhizobium lusitanum TaxID=293958 RepID=A0A7X0MF17_9HYPH|nr:type I secretion system permease/ATPase [Rhizobium lusitanum]MBB6488512.1 PrtD family type I secretion system ABC transporter [Rhizobium lusitanum]
MPTFQGQLRDRLGLRRAWIEIAIFTIVVNALLLVPSLYMMQVYDRILPAASITTLIYLSLIATAALALLAVLDIVRSFYCQRVAVSLDRELGEAAFVASMNSPRAESGDTQPLRDLSTVRTFVASKGLANLVDLPFVPFFLVLLLFIHPILSLVTLAGAIGLIILVIINQAVAHKAGLRAQEASVTANLLAQSFVRNADTVRGMGMTDNILHVWGNHFAQAARSQDSAAGSASTFAGISKVIRMALQMAILGTGAVLVMRGEMTGGMIFASSMISGRALQPIDQLVAGWRQVFDARKAWQRLKETLSSDQMGQQRRIELPEPSGQISVRDLVWAPAQTQGAAPVLKRLNFDIAAGEAIAILGPSGAGKSTLARLLAGIGTPTGGSLSLDGADYRTWNTRQFGRNVGYLAQDVQLLPGSIAQNIARFDPSASDDEVTTAAGNAEAHTLILGQRQGYQTVISSSGSSLSGGTKQRIGLARAFFRKPRVLILDEPNANLDAEGEAALEKALLHAKSSGTTVVIVTHRPSIVLKCDRAMIVKDGAIETIGAAADILKSLSPRRIRQAPVGDAVDRPVLPSQIGGAAHDATPGALGVSEDA